MVDRLDKLISPDDPVGGNPSGNVTIVEFFDVRCPYCRHMEPDMGKLLAQDHQVRLVYKDLPILGPPSILGSRALLAAQKQGGYEKLRTLLMQAPPDITDDTIQAAAKQAGLDWPRLKQDMNDPAIQNRLNANLQLAREMGIRGDAGAGGGPPVRFRRDGPAGAGKGGRGAAGERAAGERIAPTSSPHSPSTSGNAPLRVVANFLLAALSSSLVRIGDKARK